MVNVADLQAWIGGQSSQDAAILTPLEQRVVSLVEKRTDRYFGPPKGFVEVVDGKGRRDAWLREVPLGVEDDETPLAVSVRQSLSAAPVVLLPPSNYGLPEAPGDYELWGRKALHVLGAWPTGTANLIFTYAAGYAAGEEPPEIRQAVISLVELFYLRRGRGDLVGESDGVMSLQYNRTLDDALKALPEVRMALDGWRRGGV